MSFLINRLVSHLNKITRDPEAEQAEKEEKAKIKELIKTYKPIYNAANESIILKTQSNALEPNELKILKELNDSRKSLLDNTTGQSSDEFKTSWEDLSEKYDIMTKKSGLRTRLYSYIKVMKQARHDNPTASTSFLESCKDIEADIKKTLDTNKETDSDALYNAETQRIEKKIKQLAEQDEKNDKYIGLANDKLMKNKWFLDFEDDESNKVPENIKKDQAATKALEEDAEKDTFSISRVAAKAFSYASTIFIVCLGLFLIGLGGSFAVNLNVYKPTPYKILYAIYGCLFSLVVIPYSLLYRWAYLGKRPHFYSFMPIIPRFFVHKPVQFLLGWMTYKPDEHIWELQEWVNPKPAPQLSDVMSRIV